MAEAARDIGAQYLIASMYEKGLGVSQDLRLARYWYDVAAQNGDEAAPLKVKEIDERLRRPVSP
jgi:TPR repeat protein